MPLIHCIWYMAQIEEEEKTNEIEIGSIAYRTTREKC